SMISEKISPNSESNMLNIKLGTHFVIDTLAHAKDSDNFLAWINQLKKLYENNIEACQWFLQYLIQAKLIKELLLECQTERVRIGIADLCVFVCRIIGPWEYNVFFEEIEIGNSETEEI